MKKSFLALIATFFLLSCSVTQKPIPVIFDTDMGNDIDDALALEMLFNYEDAGQIALKGITICKRNPHSIEFVDGVCRFHGRDNMPLGFAYNGTLPDDYYYLLPTLNARREDSTLLISPTRGIDSGIDEGYLALRKLLVKEKDGSVVLIATGPLTNIANLLTSEPDDISPLDGVDLTKKKVKSLHIMNGNFSVDTPEWNTITDLDASRVVYELCPVPLIASGYEVGCAVKYPHESILNDFGDPNLNPLTVAYMHYQPMPYDRETWDLTSVFDALDPDRSIFVRSEPGRVEVLDDGTTIFTPDPDGHIRYLSVPDPEKAKETLVKRVAGQ
ncbi:MAG: nucleoside hydrolase [Bacteroidales bacterium]|nr:nucleoside hydrolase [Bacteroidales bacterium]